MYFTKFKKGENMRITNIIINYDESGKIIEYVVSVDNWFASKNSLSANLVIEPADIDITSIAEVCKQKLRETVG